MNFSRVGVNLGHEQCPPRNPWILGELGELGGSSDTLLPLIRPFSVADFLSGIPEMPDDQTTPDPITIPIEPELDLHAFHPRDIPSVVEEYIHAACAAGLHEVRLVHGRGRGVQRGIVQATLERHPLVVEFWDDAQSHLGATVARLARA